MRKVVNVVRIILIVVIIMMLFRMFDMFCDRDMTWHTVGLILFCLWSIPEVGRSRIRKIRVDNPKYSYIDVPIIYADDYSKYRGDKELSYEDVCTILDEKGVHALRKHLLEYRCRMNKHETEEIINRVYSLGAKSRNEFYIFAEVEALLNKNLKFYDSNAFSRFIMMLFE